MILPLQIFSCVLTYLYDDKHKDGESTPAGAVTENSRRLRGNAGQQAEDGSREAHRTSQKEVRLRQVRLLQREGMTVPIEVHCREA